MTAAVVTITISALPPQPAGWATATLMRSGWTQDACDDCRERMALWLQRNGIQLQQPRDLTAHPAPGVVLRLAATVSAEKWATLRHDHGPTSAIGAAFELYGFTGVKIECDSDTIAELRAENARLRAELAKK